MFSLDVRWLDTEREEKRIIATKNAKIAKKGRATGLLSGVVVRGLTTPQKRTVENSHKERRDRTGDGPNVSSDVRSFESHYCPKRGSEIATKNAKTAKREGPNVSLDVPVVRH